MPTVPERARRLETESGERIDRIAAKLGLVSERDIAAADAELLVAAAEFPAEPVGPERIRRMFLKQARVILLAESVAALVVAMPIRSTMRRRGRLNSPSTRKSGAASRGS